MSLLPFSRNVSQRVTKAFAAYYAGMALANAKHNPETEFHKVVAVFQAIMQDIFGNWLGENWNAHHKSSTASLELSLQLLARLAPHLSRISSYDYNSEALRLCGDKLVPEAYSHFWGGIDPVVLRWGATGVEVFEEQLCNNKYTRLEHLLVDRLHIPGRNETQFGTLQQFVANQPNLTRLSLDSSFSDNMLEPFCDWLKSQAHLTIFLDTDPEVSKLMPTFNLECPSISNWIIKSRNIPKEAELTKICNAHQTLSFKTLVVDPTQASPELCNMFPMVLKLLPNLEHLAINSPFPIPRFLESVQAPLTHLNTLVLDIAGNTPQLMESLLDAAHFLPALTELSLFHLMPRPGPVFTTLFHGLSNQLSGLRSLKLRGAKMKTLIGELHSLITYIKSTPLQIELRSLEFNASDSPELFDLLEEFASLIPSLAQVDIQYQALQQILKKKRTLAQLAISPLFLL